MTTDAESNNSFIHVLIFYEEINEAEISSNDFDIVAEMLRKQHLKKKHLSMKIKTDPKFPNVREGSTGEIEKKNDILAEEGALFKKNHPRLRRNLENRKYTTKCLNSFDLIALRASNDKNSDIEEKDPCTPR